MEIAVTHVADHSGYEAGFIHVVFGFLDDVRESAYGYCDVGGPDAVAGVILCRHD